MIVTIADVAKRAGVANSTVSKVLKNYAKVSEETRSKVLDAVAELHYVPNSMASALSSKKFDRVALYIYINDQNQSIDEINMLYLLGAFAKAQKHNLDFITIFNSMVAGMNKDELVHYLYSQSVSSLVIYGLNKEDTIIHKIINEQIFKCVVVDAPIVNESTSSVEVDHLNGQYEVAKKLVDKNYLHAIMYLAGKKNGYVTDSRLAGIKKLQDEYSLDVSVFFADFSEKKAAEIVMENGTDVDGIVCASDLMAIGAVHALKQLDIFRPCCGYDGIRLMGYAGKEIYTCKQDFYHISEVAIDEIVELIRGGVGRSVKLDYKIVRIKYEDVIL